ncbi:MAG: hypothetical protein ACO1PM_23585 [Acidovorax sp.]
MARIERGDPSVAMASYLMCMWLINQAHGLADLVAPLQDHTALEHEVIRVRQKGKRPSAPNQAPVPRAVAGGRQRIAKPAAKKTVGPVAANQHCHGLGQPSTSASVNQRTRETPQPEAWPRCCEHPEPGASVSTPGRSKRLLTHP